MKRHLCSLVLLTAFVPLVARGVPFPPMANLIRAPLAATAVRGVAAVAVAAPGGIDICRPVREGTLAQVRYDAAHRVLLGLTRQGTRAAVDLSPEEAGEVFAAGQTARSCLEVSLDPMMDQQSSYASPELDRAPTVARALLSLDGEIAELLDDRLPGGHDDSDGPSVVATAKQLLSAAGDCKYQELARLSPRPPTSWHSTVITIDPLATDAGSLVVRVDPKVMVMTPDLRRLALSEEMERTAVQPYQPIANKLAAHPHRFAAKLEHLEASLRYARAFALVSECSASTSCRLMPADERPFTMPTEDVDVAALAQQIESGMRTVLKLNSLTSAWRQYRTRLEPTSITPEVRIRMFVDEAIAWYADLSTASTLLSGGDPAWMMRLIDGVDVTNSPYRGWVELGRFLAGTWTGRPTEEVVAALSNAEKWARQHHDDALLGFTLHSGIRLLPVVASNAHLQNSPSVPFHESPLLCDLPVQGPRAATDEECIARLGIELPARLRAHVTHLEIKMESLVSSLFAHSGAVVASHRKAVDTLSRFEHVHLMDDRQWLEEKPLLQMGRLYYAVGASAVGQHHLEDARNFARLLSSLSSATRSLVGDDDQDTDGESTTLKLLEWADQFDSWSAKIRSSLRS